MLFSEGLYVLVIIKQQVNMHVELEFRKKNSVSFIELQAGTTLKSAASL